MVELLVYITLMLCDTAHCFVALGVLAEMLFVCGRRIVRRRLVLQKAFACKLCLSYWNDNSVPHLRVTKGHVARMSSLV